MGRSNEERNRLNDWSWTRITFDSRDKRALFSLPYDCACTVPPWERKRKKRKALNLDAKSLLNGSWQTMGDVNLFILLRMYRASCITLLPRVLRVDVYYFLLYYIEILPYDVVRYRSFKIFPFIFEYLNIIIPSCVQLHFSRAWLLYLSIFQISRAEILNSTCKPYLFDSFIWYSFQYSALCTFTVVRSELP